MALASSRVQAPARPAAGSPAVPRVPARARCLVAVRAAPKVTREYRESDDSMSMPGASPSSSQPAQAPGAMYVDDSAPARAPPKKGNLSKEMKARLRQEYVGLGGAENAAMSNNYFLWMIGIVAVLAISSKMIGAI